MKRGKSIETFAQFTVYMALAMCSMCILIACGVRDPAFFIVAPISTTFLSIYAFEAGYEKEYYLLLPRERDYFLSSYRKVFICTMLGFGYLARELFRRLTRFR